jgi:serralysin
MEHEIGHALGLSHPGTYNAGSGGTITYANNATFAQDNREYTIMSYFGGYLPGVGWQQDGTYGNYLYPQTPMIYDVAAIQAKYGADMTTRTGDTTYGFHSTITGNEQQIFDFSKNATPIFTIWDAGGVDTIDCSGYAGSQVINLTPGTYSSVDGMVSNVGIAFNTYIEKAIGGAGNDILIGGSWVKTLNGGNGSDIYLISAGSEHIAADIADSGTVGTDEVRFASTTVNDTLKIYAGDTGIEKVVIGTGTATNAITTGTTALNINASASTKALTIVGNAGANTIIGTSYADIIYGDGGKDVIIGGGGGDTFVFNFAPNSATNVETITDFISGSDIIQLSKAVFNKLVDLAGATLNLNEFYASATATSGHDTTDRVVYNTANGNMYYDADGSGSSASVLIATLGVHPKVAYTDIHIVA